MAESWAWWGAKLVGKIGAKITLNLVAPGLGSAVDFGEAVSDFYHGDIVGGTINTISGVVDVATLGLSSSIKETMKGSAKKAVVQTAKETAKDARKEATKKVGQELRKKVATGAVKGGKDFAVRAARAAAESAGKAATKEVGEKVAKEFARGVITETVEEVFQQGTKMTIDRMGHKVVIKLIASGGCMKTLSSSFAAELLTGGFEEFLKGSASKRLVFELTQKAATTAAEEEFKKHAFKLIAKEYGLAVVEGSVRLATKPL